MLLKTAQHKSGLDCEAGSPISAQLGRDVGGRGEERVKRHWGTVLQAREYILFQGSREAMMISSSYISEPYKSFWQKDQNISFYQH